MPLEYLYIYLCILLIFFHFIILFSMYISFHFLDSNVSLFSYFDVITVGLYF